MKSSITRMHAACIWVKVFQCNTVPLCLVAKKWQHVIKEMLIYCPPGQNQFAQAKARLVWQAVHGLHGNTDVSVFP